MTRINALYSGAEPDEVWPLVRDHHYSGRMPGNIQRCYVARRPGGLFGDTGEPTAAVLFSIPPTRWSEPVLELSRLVRIPTHDRPLSELIAFACRWMNWRDFNLVVSFADFTQNHHGGIYQAAGWNFSSFREPTQDGLVINGRFVPGRSANSRYGTRSPAKLAAALPNSTVESHWDAGKYLYWRALHRSGDAKAHRLGLERASYPKPTAARRMDAPVPTGSSQAQPLGAAPPIAPEAA